jgi:Ca-activated chloride channel family protein
LEWAITKILKWKPSPDKGNGNYAYIDNIYEAKKTLVSEFGGTMYTIAKDVKLQLEFNPSKVKAYRLVGYENRLLADEDFNDDTKDAGEMGAGHTVTALYEIIPVGVESEFLPDVDELKYQSNKIKNSKDIVNVKVRYKQPLGNKSVKFEVPVKSTKANLNETSDNFRFSAQLLCLACCFVIQNMFRTAIIQQCYKWLKREKGWIKQVIELSLLNW